MYSGATVVFTGSLCHEATCNGHANSTNTEQHLWHIAPATESEHPVMNLALLFAHIQSLGLQRLKEEQNAQLTLMTSSSCMHADAAQQNSEGASSCVHILSDLTHLDWPEQ